MEETGAADFEEQALGESSFSLAAPIRSKMPRTPRRPAVGFLSAQTGWDSALEPRWERMAQPLSSTAHLWRGPAVASRSRQRGQETLCASLECGAGSLSLKVIPTTGLPQSLRRPAPHPIRAPRSSGPPSPSLPGAVTSVGSTAGPEQATRLPFWGRTTFRGGRTRHIKQINH